MLIVSLYLYYYELFLGIPVSIPLLHSQSVSKTEVYLCIPLIIHYVIHTIYTNESEFGISNLCDKPAFINNVDIHWWFLGHQIICNKSGNQI